MLHFRGGGRFDPRDFWHEVPPAFGRATSTDLFIGRHAAPILAALGLEEITVDYVIVDPLRVPRDTMAAIFEAWRDGYTDASAEVSRFTRDEAAAYFEAMIANVRDPQGYAVWMVPVVAARVP
jgi:hypothetical protein